MEEFVARGDGAVDGAEHGGGDHAGVLFFYAAHHHAQVAGFDDDADAGGFQGVHEGAGDLVGEAFLHLQAAGEEVGEAGQFADTDDASAGDVADVADAEKGQQVVFANRVDFDVADDDHVVVFCFENGVLEEFGGGFGRGGADQVFPGVGGAAGGVYEAGAVGVFAEGENPLFDDVLHGADLAISGGGGQS